MRTISLSHFLAFVCLVLSLVACGEQPFDGVFEATQTPDDQREVIPIRVLFAGQIGQPWAEGKRQEIEYWFSAFFFDRYRNYGFPVEFVYQVDDDLTHAPNHQYPISMEGAGNDPNEQLPFAYSYFSNDIDDSTRLTFPSGRSYPADKIYNLVIGGTMDKPGVFGVAYVESMYGKLNNASSFVYADTSAQSMFASQGIEVTESVLESTCNGNFADPNIAAYRPPCEYFGPNVPGNGFYPALVIAISAAHELGHMFGATHTPSPPDGTDSPIFQRCDIMGAWPYAYRYCDADEIKFSVDSIDFYDDLYGVDRKNYVTADAIYEAMLDRLNADAPNQKPTINGTIEPDYAPEPIPTPKPAL